MKILTIGASGYLGGGAARALRAAGHDVIANARTEESAQKMRALGYKTVSGDVENPASLAEAAAASDGVVYAVQLNGEHAEEQDSNALRALLDALAGTKKPFVYTSGVWLYGNTGERVADESTQPNPLPSGSFRPRLERIVLDAVPRGIRSIVVRPGCVYGDARGLPAMFVNSAATEGAARTIGDGSNRWAMIHVDDLGALYEKLITQATSGEIYNATDDTTFTQLEIAQAASHAVGGTGSTVPWPVEKARAALGPWVAALAMDQRVTSARARARLGWKPREKSVLHDLEFGSYRKNAAAAAR